MNFWGSNDSSSKSKWEYKEKNTLDKRLLIARKVRDTHPYRVPVIVQTMKDSQLKLTREKFLAPVETRVGRFLQEIRRALDGDVEANHQKALFLLVGDDSVLVPTGSTMGVVYEKYKDSEDGMIYMALAMENTFG